MPKQPEPTVQETARAALNGVLAADLTEYVKGEVTLANGVVIGAKAVPATILRRLMSKLPEPPIPTWHDDISDRDEENPTDPDYLAAIEVVYQSRIEATGQAYIALGTYFISAPPDVYPPDGDAWVQNLESAGVTLNLATRESRYLDWLQLYAITEDADYQKLTAAVTMKSGPTEQEVADAIAYFWSHERWRADRGLPPLGPDVDGDPVRD